MERQKSLRRRRKYDVPFSKKVKECARTFVAFMFSNVGIVGLVVGYVAAGAFIFIEIEGKASMVVVYDAAKVRAETADRIMNLTILLNTFEKEVWLESVSKEIRTYQENTVEAIRAGLYHSDVANYTQWTIPGALLYSLTVITTIGYGNIVPRTYWGKLTTIIYAIIGMPLFLLYLSNTGDIMARSFKWIYATCCLCKGCPGVSKRRAERRRRRQEQLDMEAERASGSETSDGSWPKAPDSLDGYAPDVEGEPEGSEVTTALSDESFDTQTVTVPVTICLTIMVGYIFGGVVLFATYEGWNYLDGFYFCFISLSTIGFGDIVPGNNSDTSDVVELSFIFCTMYLLLGMALIAMCFNLMQEEVIHKFRTAMATIKFVLRCDR